MSLYTEIIEKPERFKSLLVSQKKTVKQIASAIQKRDTQYVFLAARGILDNERELANVKAESYSSANTGKRYTQNSRAVLGR